MHSIAGRYLAGGQEIRLGAVLQPLVSPIRGHEPLVPVKALQTGRLADAVGGAGPDTYQIVPHERIVGSWNEKHRLSSGG